MLHMLSPSSLSAFSHSNATAPLNRGGAASGARLVRMVQDAPPAQAPNSVLARKPGTTGAGETQPSRLLPRGSLLDLSV